MKTIEQCDACGAENVKGKYGGEAEGAPWTLCRFCYATSFGMVYMHDPNSSVKSHISQCFNTLAEILEGERR